MRTWDDWNPATRCVWQHFGETCPRGGVHLSREQWRRCFLAYFHQHGVPNAPTTPPPSLDVAAADGGGGPRSAGRATGVESRPVRAGLAGLRDRAQTFFDPDRGTTAERIGRRLQTWWQTRRGAAQPVHRTGDQAPPDTRTDPATYDPGPTYGWGAIHTGRNWRRWL